MPEIAALSFRKKLQYASAWGFLAIYLFQLVLISYSTEFAWWHIALIPVAFYLADAVSGIAHFILDYTPTPKDVGLKELFFWQGSKGTAEYTEQRNLAMKRINALDEVIFDFKIHHISPGTLARRSFLQVALPIIYFASLPLSVAFISLYFLGLMNTAVFMFLWAFIGALTVSQYAHSCAHKRELPKHAFILQKAKLFLTAEQHDSHHSDLGHDFCMLNGWANPLVNTLFNLCRKRGWFDDKHLTPA